MLCRRTECYQCQRGRTPGARPVLSPADEPPSCILRVAGVQVGVGGRGLLETVPPANITQ